MNIAILAIGLAVGSFVGVCVCRVPAGESVVTGASHCGACGRRIAPYDLVPVISYLLLGGRCRHCRAKIGSRALAVEIMMGAVLLSLFHTAQLWQTKALYAACMAALITAGFIDADTMEVPNGLSLFILLVGALSFADRNLPGGERLAGLLIFSGTLLVAALASRGGMGAGDIKLVAGCGLLLGGRLSLVALFASLALGLAAALPGLVADWAGKKPAGRRKIPFVPPLAAGIFLTMLFGERWWLWYLAWAQ